MTTRFLLHLSLVPLLACPAVRAAADWPQFRGPTGDGIAAPDADPPVEWSETKNVAWKVATPGRGRSSPVLLGNRIFLTTAAERNVKRTKIGFDDMQVAEHVAIGAFCLDATDGKLLWQVTLWECPNPDPVHWLNSWATPTPVAEAGRVYCDFGTFGTACLDTETGKTIWSKRIPLDHQVGPGSSPILSGDLLILVRDGRDAQYVTALDKKTGEQVWKTDRPPLQASSNNVKKSFSTPLVIQHDGKAQLFSMGPHWAVAYEPATGKELWRLKHGAGFSIGTRPIFGHGLLFAGTGCMKAQLLAIQPDGQGDVTGKKVAWSTPRQVPVMSSPILVGDDIYWVSDSGAACCVDAKTGKDLWQQPLGGSHLASPLLAAGRLYFCGQDGKTTVIKPGKAFERIAENTLDGNVTATPAAVGRALFLRTDSHMCRLETK